MEMKVLQECSKNILQSKKNKAKTREMLTSSFLQDVSDVLSRLSFL